MFRAGLASPLGLSRMGSGNPDTVIPVTCTAHRSLSTHVGISQALQAWLVPRWRTRLRAANCVPFQIRLVFRPRGKTHIVDVTLRHLVSSHFSKPSVCLTRLPRPLPSTRLPKPGYAADSVAVFNPLFVQTRPNVRHTSAPLTFHSHSTTNAVLPAARGSPLAR